MKTYFIVTVVFLFFLASCNNSESTTARIFNKLEKEDTGIAFNNQLTENDSLNYFTYAYIYMGGGVSAGDINNDGLIDLFFSLLEIWFLINYI